MKHITMITMLVVSLAAVGGASAAEGHMFHIEYTVYGNDTVAHLDADSVWTTEFREDDIPDHDRQYTFNFLDEDGAVLHTEQVQVYFPGHSILPPDHPDRGEPMSSSYIHVPVVRDAVELSVVHTEDGDEEELRTLDLVNTICPNERTGECDLYCDAHDVDPDCDLVDDELMDRVRDEPDDESLPLPDLQDVIPLVLLTLIVLLALPIYRIVSKYMDA